MMGLEPNTIASRNKKIAVVYATGAIMTGSSQQSLFSGEVLGSDTIVKALRTAAEDKTVEAIVLRVDSPGGSAVASDVIWREIQQIEKPVYASMGDTAASGGYYISMGCDKIFAEPGTLTGSIGVVSGKLALKDLYGKVGLTTDVIARGKNSGLFSADEKFTDSEREVMTKFMEEIYDQFTSKAAAGRGVNLKKMDTLAQGRLWSGRQAKQNGLVDEIGTLHDAIAAVKKEVGIKEGEKVELMILPKPKSLFELLLDPSASDAAIGAKAKTAIDAFIPRAGEHAADIALWQELLKEKAVLMLPYRVEIK
jgi:protease-4